MLGLLLWAEVLLVAALFQYTILHDWIRRTATGVTLKALGLGLLVLLLAPFSLPSLGVAVWTAGIVSLLDAFHEAADRRTMSAELHIAGTVLLALGSGWIVAATGLQARMPPIVLPINPNRIAAACLVASAVLFAGRGGTLIVRGVLRKTGTLPTIGSGGGDRQIDTAEYNRGRLIGDLERLLLIASVAVGAYTAMAFVIAAKGLIRIKEFEDRNFAEYFLVGTFTSTAIAFLLGLLVRATIQNFW